MVINLYMCKTIVYFLRFRWNLIYCLIINIVRMVFLILLVRVIVEFVFVLVQISDWVFLILITKFLEICCFLYNPTSYLSGCHSGLRQNKYCTRLIFFVNVCCLYLVGEVLPVFFKNVTGLYEFLSIELWYVGVGLIIDFPVFMSKFLT